MIRQTGNRNLRKLNTFGIDAVVRLFVEYSAPSDLAALDWAALPQPVRSIGEGSNMLFTGDFQGTLLHSGIKGIEVDRERSVGDDVFVTVGAGEKMDDFCRWAAGKGLWGPENLSGIPGTAGASAVQNVGAYGVEAGDIIDSVDCFDTVEKKFVALSSGECAFAYRDSFFKHAAGRYIVTVVTFLLHTDFRPRLEYGALREQVERNVELFSPSANPYELLFSAGQPSSMLPLTPMLVRETVLVIREEKLPDIRKTGSAGSFFKNPVVGGEKFGEVKKLAGGAEVPHYDLPDGGVKIPAAWLIDSCGLKGCRRGGAGVWDRQPLVIVNADGRATASDILSLEKHITDTVRDRYGITLEPEVEHI